MGLCKRWEKTVWHIDKNAQIEMGFVRKNRQLFIGLERNQKINWKKYIISQVCIFKQTVRKFNISETEFMIFVFLLSGSLAYIIFPLGVVQTLCTFFFFASTLRAANNSEFLLVRSPLIWIVPPWLKKMQFHKLFV